MLFINDDLTRTLQSLVDKKDAEEFSPYALSLVNNSEYYGILEPSQNVYIQAYRGPCGDEMVFYLEIKEKCITQAKFETDGCITSVIAGVQTLKMVHLRSIFYAQQLKDQDVLNALGKFPASSAHCCTLAVETLKRTLELFNKRSIYGIHL